MPLKVVDEVAQFRWIVERLPEGDRQELRDAIRAIRWRARKWLEVLQVYASVIVG